MSSPREHSVERLEALLAEQSALRRVATLVAADPEPRRLFDTVCEELGRVLGVDSTDMLRYGHDGTATVVGAWNASGAPSFPVGTSVPVDGQTVTAKLYRSGHPERVDDYADVGGDLAHRLRTSGIQSAVGAPIKVAGRLWGAIMVVGDRPYAFPDGTEERSTGSPSWSPPRSPTRMLANSSLRRVLDSSRPATRSAVGSSAIFTTAPSRSSSAPRSAWSSRDRSGRRGPTRRWSSWKRRARKLQGGLRDLRELAAGIHPSVLSDRGLGAALEALAARSAVPVELGPLPAERLPAAVETTAYFVVAEALTNAAKHARCEHTEVAVRIEESWTVVEVRDDGVGGADPSGGSGLRGLADRVSALGGELQVDSLAGAGTTIRARMALSTQDPPAGVRPRSDR